MAYISRRANANSIAIARQSDATTENTTDGDFGVIPCEFEAEDLWESEDLQLAAGQFGASEAPQPGRRHASVTMRGIVSGLKSAYDYTADAVDASGVPSPVLALLGAALGSGGAAAVSSSAEFLQGYHGSRETFSNGEVNAGGSTTTVVNVADQSTFTSGQFVSFRTDADEATPANGWVKTLTNAGQDTVTTFGAMAAAPANADDRAPSVTYYLSSLAPPPLTIRRLGVDAAEKRSYTGFVAEALTLDLEAGKTPKWEIKGKCLARTRYSTGGGLLAPAVFKPVRAIVGNNNGALLGNGAALAGWHSLKVEVNWELIEIQAHGKPEGVSELVRVLRAESPVMVSAVVPLQTSDSVAGGLDSWEVAFRDGTTYSLELRSGTVPGGCMGVLLPSLHLAAPPKRVDLNGLDAYELSLRADTYSLDDGSTAPADTVIRIGIA